LKIELRNVKHFAAGSEETACFTATVYVDDKKAGTAQNHGTGGPTMVHPFTVEKQINDYAATLPKASSPMGGGTVFEYAQTAETLIDALLSQHLVEKDLRKLLSSRIVFTASDARGIFQSKAYPAAQRTALLANPTLRAKWKIAVILNELPFDEALALYKANAK
jgi:hypothetical protein